MGYRVALSIAPQAPAARAALQTCETLRMGTLIPCIIAGGAGTRLWPVSREALPKPFMRLPDGMSLLQKTFQRLQHLRGVERLLTVTHRDLYFRTLDDYRPLNTPSLALDFILEPFGRNTAAAITAAALHALQRHGPETQLLVLPADHLIHDVQAFASAVENARSLAEQGWLVTFGLVPSRAETGFGYIEQGESLGQGGFKVARFVEKPDRATAQGYLEGARHLWNGGMLCSRVDALLQEMAIHAPQLLTSVENCLSHSHGRHAEGPLQLELDGHRFTDVADISIDYALLEHSSRVAVIPCELGWSDIGSWEAVRELSPSDALGNQCTGETLLRDVSHCFIDAPQRLVGAIGLRNLVIVDTPDALLIADASRTQEVGHLARELKHQGHAAYRLHRSVSCPWGNYTVLEEGPRFKVKRLVVHPHAALSLQRHQHRSEHWIVVSGLAQVTHGERQFVLGIHESTFISPGQRHRLANPGDDDLVIIEVQSGDYLGEDDIERFTDAYGRVDP